MSKRKEEVGKSDLSSKKSPTPSLAVAGRDNTANVDEIGIAPHTDFGYQNRDARSIEERKEAKASSRRVQLTALSKVVNTAFTGWTIKTQS